MLNSKRQTIAAWEFILKAGDFSSLLVDSGGPVPLNTHTHTLVFFGPFRSVSVSVSLYQHSANQLNPSDISEEHQINAFLLLLPVCEEEQHVTHTRTPTAGARLATGR